ncbi:hypothetical protein JCM15764A_16490 [Geotalea toluenoxydans]
MQFPFPGQPENVAFFLTVYGGRHPTQEDNMGVPAATINYFKFEHLNSDDIVSSIALRYLLHVRINKQKEEEQR